MHALSFHWLAVVLDVSIKTLLLCGVAMLLLRLLRLRDSNVRHRVWTGVMAGMLLLPFLAAVLPAVPLPIQWDAEWLAELRRMPAQPTDEGIQSRSTVLPNISESSDANLSEWNVPDDQSDRRASLAMRGQRNGAGDGTDTRVSSPAAANDVGDIQTDELNVREDGQISVANVVDNASESRSSLGIPLWKRLLLHLPRAMFVGWLIGAVILAIRLFAGLYGTARLLRRSPIVAGDEVTSCQTRLPDVLRQRPVHVRECADVLVPVTVGWFRPTVLLPPDWRNWSAEKLQAVLTHEFTHVARRDFVVAILAELNRCLYWFHPVSWWLRRQLSDLAEEACDDAAIGFTGDPAGYARHLLEVASALTNGRGRIIQPGLSMARESNVETRITAILDFTRPLSKRLTWKATAIIAAVAVPVIGFAAALQPKSQSESEATTGPSVASEESKAADEIENPASDAATAIQSRAAKDFRIHGRVVDAEGNGVAARVRLFRVRSPQWYAATRPSTLVAEVPIKSDGSFDGSVPREKLPPHAKAQNWNDADWAILVITASGFANQTHYFGDYDESPPINVSLSADVPVRGRLLNLEGQPVANASVTVRSQRRPGTEELDGWLSRASKMPLPDTAAETMRMMSGPSARESLFPNDGQMQLPPASIEPIVTGSDGTFALPGVGPDDLLLLDIQGSGIAKTTLHVLGRDMETVYGRHASNISQSGAYYGRNFSYVTQPSVPVFGIVRDEDTKEPIPNLTIAVGGLYGTTMSHTGYLSTTTDDEGRYRIEGLPVVPKGTGRYDGNKLAIRPTGLPYIENDWIMIPAGDGGLDPIEFNIDLKRAVMAKGRLTNKVTGEPVKASLYYSPFNTNEHIADHPRFNDGVTAVVGNESSYHSDENGYFEVPVIPGRGVLAARCEDGGFRTSFGALDIPEFANGTVKDGGPVTSDHLVPSMFHSLKAIDVPATGVDEFQVDLQTDPGLSIDVMFVDANGKPVSDVWVTGLDTDRRGRQVSEDHAEAFGLALGEIRPLYVNQRERELVRFARLVPAEGQTEFVVTLLPTTKLNGRLIDPESQPLTGVPVEARYHNDPDFMSSLQPGQQTDDTGRFEYSLPVGTKYTLIGHNGKYFKVAEDLDVQEPQHIDLGDLVVDPDAERWAPVKAKREPVVSERKPEQASVPSDVQPTVVLASLTEPTGSKENASLPAAAGDLLHFKGDVVGPTGKPFAGAKIFLIYWGDSEPTADEAPLAVSRADGTFSFTIDPSDPANGRSPGAGTLVAVADGYAFGHVVSARCETTGRLLESFPEEQRKWIREAVAKASDTMQLTQDEPVRGRVVDTEGQPVAGAVVSVRDVSEGQGGSLDAWISAAQKEKADYYSARNELNMLFNGPRSFLAVPPATTNADGWFELTGFGPHRVAEVVISGPGIASAKESVRSGGGETIELIEQWPERDLGTRKYYANGFTHVAAPSQVLAGRVTDSKTGEPIANCLIRADRISSERIGGFLSAGFIRTRTDADGRYRLDGLPLGESEVFVIPPQDSRYVAVEIRANGTNPLQETTRDVELIPGVLVEGRVTDSRTGDSVAGRFEYAMFNTNPAHQGEKRVRLAHLASHFRTDNDGNYRIPVLPGPGVIGFNADAHEAFPRAKWTDRPNLPGSNSSGALDTQPYWVRPANYHHVAGVNPDLEQEKITLNIELTSGIDIRGKVVRSDGSEVSGYVMYGESIPGGWYLHGSPFRSSTEFLVQGYRADRAHRLIVWIPEERLIGTLLLEGEQHDPLTISVEPAGKITGRIVDEEGQPIAGVHLANGADSNDNFGDGRGDPHTVGSFPDDSETKRTLVTDENGHFAIDGLVSGLKYSGRVMANRKLGDQMYFTMLGDAFKDVTIEAGETKDLGDIVLTQDR